MIPRALWCMTNAERIYLSAACLLGCGCGSPGRPAQLSPSPSSEQAAVAAFEHITSAYGHCHTYQDRGTIIHKMWVRDGTSYTIVDRFDTIFVRDRGFRFRYFDEDGSLDVAIWNWDGRAQEVWFGTPSEIEASSVESALFDLRGVTKLTSWFVPGLLFGRPVHLGEGPSYVGSDCLWCLEIAFRSPKQDLERYLRLNLRRNVVQRLDELDAHIRVDDNKASSGSAETLDVTNGGTVATSPLVRAETLVLYETPSFDADESMLIAEMQKGLPAAPPPGK
jgi:hypothetical protein